MTGYVRKDTTNNIADGNVINAADLDSEFDGVQAAFNSSTGHTHDGTASEGAPITKLGPVQDVTISTTVLGVKTTNTVDLGTSSLKFKDFYLAGNASIGGTLGVTGATTLSAALTYGGVTLSNAVTGTGNMVLSASPTLTGTAGFANITASGTLNVTGITTLTAQPILSSLTASQAVFTDASKGLVSNTITGTGSVVMSASPTLTGTITAAAANFSGAVALNGNTTIGDADTDTITQAASYVTGTQLKSAKTATNTLSLAAYDVDGTAYTNLITLTASNTPTLALTSTGVGTINNISIGATTASTGAFTTLTSNGATTFTAGTASTTTGTGTLVITGGLGVSERINAANFDGIVGANTAAAGSFTTLSASSTVTLSGGTVNGVAYLDGSKVLTTGSALVFDGSNLVVGATSSSSQAFRVSQTSFPAVPSGFYCSAGDGAGAYQYGITRVDATNGRGFQFLSSLGAGNLPFYSISVGTAASTIAGMTFSEALRIDSSGNLLVGTTTAGAKFTLQYDGGVVVGQNINDSANTTNSTLMQFLIQGTQVGTIKRVGATSAIIYNTSSDYRLKTVVGAVTGQGDRIDALKPINYLWKEGNTSARGFLAHEFQEVYASSVSGDKDAVDANGNPVYQAMQASTSEVIADLVAEIQSLRKRLAVLESA